MFKFPDAFVILLGTFLSCVLGVAAQTTTHETSGPQPDQAVPPNLSLDEAVRTALDQHPVLRAGREAIAAAEARAAQAKSGYYPQISASGIGKQGLSGASGALGLRGLVTSPLFRDIGASAAAFQNIFDFGRTAHQVKASRWAAVSLKHVLAAQQAAITLDVQRDYYQVLEQQGLVKVAEETLAEMQLTVKQAAAFQKAELKSKLDLTLAEVSAANARLRLIQTQERLKTAYAELNHAMGVEGAPAYVLEEPAVTLQLPEALETWILEARQQRPELAALDAQIQVDTEIVSLSKRNRWPRLMALLSGGWVRFSELTPGRLLLGAFGVDVPVFTGGRIENEIVEAKARLAHTQAVRDSLVLDVRLEVQRAYNELPSALESVRAGESLINQAREALRLAQVQYRVQLGSFVELSAAQAAAAGAEAQYASARYGYKIAEAILRFAAGRSFQP